MGARPDHSRKQTPFMAVHLILEREDGALLWPLRQGTGWRDGYYSLVAGHVDAWESARGAMVREAREEIGVTLSPHELELVVMMHRCSDTERADLFFHVAGFGAEVENLEPDKCAGLVWARVEDAPSPRVPYIDAAIQAWRQGEVYIEYGW